MPLVSYDNSSDESEEERKPVKKQKESVKITIPSLKEFEDEEDEKPVTKKPKFQSGSGLFSLLPPPKNISSAEKSGFMPHILLSKKPKSLTSSTQSKNSTTPVSIPLKTITAPTSALTESEEQASDDENVSAKDTLNPTGGCDFFWLDDLTSKNETKTQDPAKGCTFLKDLSSQLPCSSTSNVHQTYLKEAKEDIYPQQHQQLLATDVSEVERNTNCISSDQQCQSIDDNYINILTDDAKETLLNEKEFLKSQGRKREFENIDIIDVNADDQLTNRNEWLMKSVTEEMTHRPKKKHGLPTQQQKRKHQITYLAFQAKEREMDLKNQWALNRLTRRETQSKYGF